MMMIILMEWLAIGVMVISSLFAGHLVDGGPFSSAFVNGLSSKMQLVWNEAKGIPSSDIKDSKRIFLTLTFVSMLFVLSELICYIIIYRTLVNSDSSIKSMVSKETFNKRSRRNVITLAGQSFSFVVEFGFGVTVLITLYYQLDPAISLTSVIVTSSLLSLINVMTSHELRRYINF